GRAGRGGRSGRPSGETAWRGPQRRRLPNRQVLRSIAIVAAPRPLAKGARQTKYATLRRRRRGIRAGPAAPRAPAVPEATTGGSMAFQGRVAVITGASSGIGWALAKTLAGQGARVGLVARRLDKLEALEGEIRQAGGT